jgi:hypothetical protein
VPPGFVTTELGEGWFEAEAEEFFSKNFLLMLTALNLFGCDEGPLVDAEAAAVITGERAGAG